MLTLEKKPDFRSKALAAFERSFSGDGAPAPFADIRRNAFDTFSKLGIPTRRHEAWKYTNVEQTLRHDYTLISPGDAADRLAKSDLDEVAVPGLDALCVVVLNGAFSAALSDDLSSIAGLEIGGLRQAALADGGAVGDYFARYADPDEDAFIALNTAFDLDGIFLHVRRGATIERPIHVIHVIDAEADSLVQTRHLHVIEEGAIATIIESHHVLPAGSAVKTFENAVTEIVVGQRANLSHYRIQDAGNDAAGVNTTQVYQRGGSTFSGFTFTFRSGLVRNNVNVVPDGEGCESNLNGLAIILGDQHVDNHTLVDHAKPNCQSNELYKSIVAERGTGVFNGKVFVRRDAQQTNAYQQSQGVVLSDDARHFSKPELEIYADDVKCSHGSTTGEMEPEALFYLRARGISEVEARALLLYAFARDLVESVRVEPLREWLQEMVTRRLDAIT
ncbi:Fe-S cluster assembly protein SufD [soil metagenome]